MARRKTRSRSRPSRRRKSRKPKTQRKARGRTVPYKSKRKKGLRAHVIYTTKSLSRDKLYRALPPGRRVSRTGHVYYEYRSNRSDVNPRKGL